MKSQRLYREMGLIDESFIKASEVGNTNKKKIYVIPKWIVCVLSLMILSSALTVLLAKEYYENRNKELYMRYLTTEDMELVSTPSALISKSNTSRLFLILFMIVAIC